MASALSAILYVTSKAHFIKVRQGDQWVTPAEVPRHARWHIVTNLIDDRFSQIHVPPMGFADRRSFLQMQLNSQFQNTTFRAILPYTSPSQKNQFILTGISDSQSIEQAIQNLEDPEAAIVGAWSLPTLLMNALLSQQRRLPSIFLAMLSTPEGIRLLFVKSRQPILTRLLPSDISSEQLSQEILATRRYLEDDKSIERQTILDLMVIGPSLGWTHGLESYQFKLLKANWGGNSTDDAMNTLFNMALLQPAGQVAGLDLRKNFLALNVRNILITATATFSALGLLVFFGMGQFSLSKYQLLDQAHAEMTQLHTQHQEKKQHLTAIAEKESLLLAMKHLYEVDLGWPNLVSAGLHRLSQVLYERPEVSLQNLEWRYTEFDQACQDRSLNGSTAHTTTMITESRTTSPSNPPLTGEVSPRRMVLEMRVEFIVPMLISPLMAARQKETLTQDLQKQNGLKVHRIGKSGHDDGHLVGGGGLVKKSETLTQGKTTDLSSCLSFTFSSG